VYLGGFATEAEAVDAYDRAAIVFFGTGAPINVRAALLPCSHRAAVDVRG
jgi:hypothetical protein